MIENNIASMFKFMTNIEKVLMNDEHLLRLLKYRPRGYDEENQVEYLDPLDDRLPNVLDTSSDEYWRFVIDRIRKGEKRIKLENDVKCFIYIHEGVDRSIFGNACVIEQEVVFGVYIHEEFESDWRMSRIKDRLTHLLVHQIEMAGYGKFEYIGGDLRDATTGYRRIDYRYIFRTAKRRKY